MALEVEDGTGKSNAESYLSVADADSYWTALGTPSAWSGSSTTEKEQALRKATNYIDAIYGPQFRGVRAVATQRLRFPRAALYDDEGSLISSTSVPEAVKNSTAILANAAREDGDLLVDLDSGGSIGGERVKVGPIEIDTSYNAGKVPQKQYTEVDALLAPFVNIYGAIERA
jgi:hypothetical protein